MNPRDPGLILISGDVPAPVCVDGVCAPGLPADGAQDPERTTPAP
jgi:hypothetical protein